MKLEPGNPVISKFKFQFCSPSIKHQLIRYAAEMMNSQGNREFIHSNLSYLANQYFLPIILFIYFCFYQQGLFSLADIEKLTVTS